MTVSAAIAEASMPDTHIVCGVALRPLSIAHCRAMHRFGVSFVTGANHTLGDLLLSVLICSQTAKQFEDSIASGGIAQDVRRWQRRLSGGFIAFAARRIKRLFGARIEPSDVLGLDVNRSREVFQTYLDTFGFNRVVNDWARPVTQSLVEGSGAMPSAPEYELLFDALTSQCGVDSAHAVDMSLSVARWRVALNAERRGLVRIMDVSELRDDQRQANDIAEKVHRGELKM